ncbi:MAG: hypothetical protein EXR71_12110 [Myxococcales bacterium]|nr:hypothetical protein [Myxococcales bacterium]
MARPVRAEVVTRAMFAVLAGCIVDEPVAECQPERCWFAEWSSCPDDDATLALRFLVSDAGPSVSATPSPSADEVTDAVVEVFHDWTTLQSRLAVIGVTLGAHETLDFDDEQVIIAWEYTAPTCETGLHVQGVRADGTVTFADILPCAEESCATEAAWFGNLLVMPAVPVATCIASSKCGHESATGECETEPAECPATPEFTMLNAGDTDEDTAGG